MKTLFATLLLSFLSLAGALAGDPHVVRYIGEWSDGRGEVLVVTADKFRIGGKVSSYKEIAR